MTRYPVTPDGRYFVVRRRLWRRSDPSLTEEQRQTLVSRLMRARRAVRTAQQQDDSEGLKQARQAVHHAKVALGERGPVWWDDGAPDYNRYMVHNTPYRQWYESLEPPAADAPSQARPES